METMIHDLHSKLPFLHIQRFAALTPQSHLAQIHKAHHFKTRTFGGERGCYASHVAIFLKVLEDEDIGENDWLLIMEDDAYMDSDLDTTADTLKRLWSWLHKAPAAEMLDMMQLGVSCLGIHRWGEKVLSLPSLEKELEGSPYTIISGLGQTTHAFLMRKRAMRRFLKGPMLWTSVIDLDLVWDATLHSLKESIIHKRPISTSVMILPRDSKKRTEVTKGIFVQQRDDDAMDYSCCPPYRFNDMIFATVDNSRIQLNFPLDKLVKNPSLLRHVGVGPSRFRDALQQLVDAM
jgi:hypothetical protein